FNAAQYGPYPAKTSADRVTDENAPMEVLVPDHPIFTTPNRIGPETWRGWVQERGTYFLGERDPRYVDLLRSQDPFPYNAGPKTGILVEARVGKGRWIYTGLGLWRQLPAGTDGAYRLLANLLSLGKAPASERGGGRGGAKPPAPIGKTVPPERALASEARERSGDRGAPASERVGGRGGAKPPAQK